MKINEIVLETSQIDEGIGKWLAGAALVASLWGVNNHMAQKAYDNSPQLQKLISLHQQASEMGNQDAVDDYERRIEAHKTRIDLGKGEVLGKDGRPIKVKSYSK